VEIRGRARRSFAGSTDYYNGRQVELAQYLRIAATNIDKDGKVSIYGIRPGPVRFWGMLRAKKREPDGRLYYLYGSYVISGERSMSRGEAASNNLSAESSLIDGARFDVKNIVRVGFTFSRRS